MNEKIIEIMETENISALKELINDELDISTDRVKTSVYLELLETLFTNNFDINLVNEQGVTPLMMASYNIDRPLVKFLLNQGADVNMKNKDGYTALIEVLDNPILMEEGFTGDLKEIIKMLIKGGADLNISPRDSEATILGIVALLGDYELCKYFIDKGADVNFGIIPPLMTLSMNMQFLSTLSKFSQEIDQNRMKNIQLLIDNGADVNAYNKGMNILMYASMFGDVEMVKILIDNGADVNATIQEKLTVLSMTLLMNIDMFKQLSYEDKNVEELFSIIQSKKWDIAKLLLKNGADINKKIYGASLLSYCARKRSMPVENKQRSIIEEEKYNTFNNFLNLGDIQVAKFLIESGADVNLGDENGITPLMFASRTNHITMLQLLIDNGVDINTEDKFGMNAYSHGKKHKEVVKTLLTYGVKRTDSSSEKMKQLLKEIKKNPTIDDNEFSLDLKIKQDVLRKEREEIFRQDTKMTKVLESKNIRDLRKLLFTGYDVSGLSIHSLINEDFSVEFIGLISKYSYKINAQNKEGYTPLMRAVELENMELVKILLQNGADENIINHEKKEAWELSENNAITQMLLDPKSVVETLHSPKELVEILSNFTKDTPLKFTTHTWDFGDLKQKYGSFGGFLDKCKAQWVMLEGKLMELSPNLYNIIYNFLFNEESITNGWMSQGKRTIGWSSLDGLAEWCDAGNKPFDFKLQTSYIDNGKELSKFGDIVNLFKQEIEIRKEYNMLENIFLDIEENIDAKYTIETKNLAGKNFYTDVEIFRTVLDKIFSEIQKRNHTEIIVEALDTTGKYIDLCIVQVGSMAQLDDEELLNEVEDGDFLDIKNALTNLCDWSVESSFGEKSYKVNYLKSDRLLPDTELSAHKIAGFTHILRFYK